MACLTCVLLATGAGAQEDQRELRPDVAVWNAWVEEAIASLRKAFERHVAGAKADARRTSYTAVREPALQPETSASAIERLTAALTTDAADAEAGISVAPFLLFRSPNAAGSALDGLSVSMAALKEGKTRLGAKFAWASSAEPPESLGDIALEPCKLDEAKLRHALQRLHSDFDLACSALVLLLKEPPTGDEEPYHWQQAQAACGEATGPRPARLINARNSLVTALNDAARSGTAVQRQAVASLKTSLELLDPRKNPLPLATGCYDAKKLKQAYRQAQWQRGTWKLGISSTAEFFPRKTGFNPTGPTTDLPHGQSAAWSIQAEAAVEKKGVSVVGSLGFGRNRAAFDDKLYNSFKPAFSISLPFARLDGQPLQSCGTLELTEDASPPPMLFGGFLVKLDYAKTRPESQTSRLNSAEYQFFLDFRVTEKVSFRLGVPYRGELVTRAKDDKAMPPTAEKRDIQWSLPVFVATVIKL